MSERLYSLYLEDIANIGKDDALLNLIDAIDDRLTALESQPIQSKAPDSTGKGEGWIAFEDSFPEMQEKYWVWGSILDDDDEGYAIPAKWDKPISVFEPVFYDKLGNEVYNVTHIMPYIPGQPKPEGPEAK